MKRLPVRLKERSTMIFKLLSLLGIASRYLDDYLVSPLAKPAFILGLVYAIINWKVVPFAWHLRVFNGYYLHYLPNSHRPPLPPISSPPLPTSPLSKSAPESNKKLTIFLPTLYKTSVPPGEIDFSFHKSNSTYLTDLDIARGYHLYTVLRRGFYLWSRTPTTDGGKRNAVTPMLGGTTCTFKKEIKPLAEVEIWTKMLTWDEKWVYLVSWFVKPRSHTVGAGGKKDVKGSLKDGDVHPDVYATCVSKIVLKEGRKTVKPEEFFRLCGLIGGDGLGSEGRQGKEDWDLKEINEAVERQRVEGMKLAGHVASLDEGHGLFGGHSVEGEGVLGVY